MNDLGTIHLRRFTRSEYERMADLGILRVEEHAELIDGTIYVSPAQSPLHAAVVGLVSRAIEHVFVNSHYRVHSPLALSDDSMPEPDVALVRGGVRSYLREYPRTGLLFVEVADASITFDRGKKLEVYAKAGIPEYWILNLGDEALEVYRDPQSDGRYAREQVLRRGESIQPLHARSAVAVGDLFP